VGTSLRIANTNQIAEFYKEQNVIRLVRNRTGAQVTPLKMTRAPGIQPGLGSVRLLVILHRGSNQVVERTQ
jgi:hypothetical protein